MQETNGNKKHLIAEIVLKGNAATGNEINEVNANDISLSMSSSSSSQPLVMTDGSHNKKPYKEIVKVGIAYNILFLSNGDNVWRPEG